MLGTISYDINSLYPATIYAPYIPEIKFNMNWQSYLGFLEIMDRTDGLIQVNESMQKQFPGPYRVVEKYDTTRMVVALALEFEDPKKEMLWKIDNG